MSQPERPSWLARLSRVAPGLPALLHYKIADLPSDLRAGVSVAAVALPVGVAYADLAGFNPVVGLYSSILPLFAYALFGTSRQLVIGPDAATCALVAAAVAPLAAGDAAVYQSMSVALAFFAGLLCIIAGFARLGALADFLSKPILTGFLNGISLSIALGQLGKIFGFPMQAHGIVPRLLEFVEKLGQTHVPTLAVGAGAFAVVLLAPRVVPRLPAALIAMVLAGLAVDLLGLDHAGVAVVGTVPAGLPPVRLPVFPADKITTLLADAAGIALISFTSGMLTARSFASKNRYDIDVDREFAALGTANIASAFSQGFAVSGADSRTAMADSTGGRTQVTGLVAALSIAVVLLFFTGPLHYVPIAALGAVLVRAAWSLVDLRSLQMLWRVDRLEFGLSVLTTLGVVAMGTIEAIGLVVGLALARFVRTIARPRDEVLGRVPGTAGFHGLDRHPDAVTTPGVLMYRFDGPLVFFNAGYFKQRLQAAVAAAGPGTRWVVIDMIPISTFDVTGALAFRDAVEALGTKGVQVVLAGRQTELRDWVAARGLPPVRVPSYPTLADALGGCTAPAGS